MARDLLGRRLEVRGGDGVARAIIVETEAYGGPEDPASHAAFKPNGRASVMWDEPGTIYVYAAYGMYPCLNIVTGSSGTPSAVLIRGILAESDRQLVWGPGRTSRALGVTLADHGRYWNDGRFTLSEDRLEHTIAVTPRIGISRGTDVCWRFVVDADSLRDWGLS